MSMPNKSPTPAKSIAGNALIIAVTAFLLLTGNATFVARTLQAYPLTAGNLLPLLSLALVFGGATVLLLAPFCLGRLTRPLLAGVLLLPSAAAYFMDSYGVVISQDMLRNVAHTNTAEAAELFSGRLLAYLLLLGVLPALAVMRLRLQPQSLRAEIASRLKLCGAALLLMVATVLAFGAFYASFFRENKDLRQRANPAYYLYSVARFSGDLFTPSAAGAIEHIGSDAAIPSTDVTRDLVIMVVGETARADRFSLNGYTRDTNPELRRHGALSFPNFWACGTSTAVSVPCMFLLSGESKGADAIHHQENLLDVLQRSGVSVLWRDNNSDSKGVAARVTFEDFRTPKTNPVCNPECRDEGMLAGLQQYIDAQPKGDILIVLHQMGNHGPAYHRRYPAEFEKFTPVCRESDLSRCSREEIGNAYDNAVLYTDHFLGKVIELLKRNDGRFETALFYVSDHGESLGENGLYLHGLPKAIAPDTQLRVPAVMWFGANFRPVSQAALQRKAGRRFSHDNVFHTLLGLFEVETRAYVPGKDLLDNATPVARN